MNPDTRPYGDDVYGLDDVLALAEGIQAHSHASYARLEQAVEAMRNGDVGPSVITQYEQMLDVATQITQAADTAYQEAARMTTVADAYTATPEAGNKNFLTNDS